MLSDTQIIITIIFSLMIASGFATMGNDDIYCTARYRRLCQGKGQHIGCQFPMLGPGPACSNYSQVLFTNDLRQFIVHYINRRRQRIASGHERVRGGAHLPQPQVMMMVDWDKELAFLAERLANQCRFVHDDCRATVRFPFAGQAVGEVRWKRLSDSDELSAQRAIRRVLDAWWGERRRVDPKQLTTPFKLPAKGTVWGHYSQLAVWTLTAIGCGAIIHGHDYPRLLLVCDFSHTNMLGQRTISPGPLAACPFHTARKSRSPYPLLCARFRYPPNAESEDIQDQDMEEIEEDQSMEKTETSTKKPTSGPEQKQNDISEEDEDDDGKPIKDFYQNSKRTTRKKSITKKTTSVDSREEKDDDSLDFAEKMNFGKIGSQFSGGKLVPGLHDRPKNHTTRRTTLAEVEDEETTTNEQKPQTQTRRPKYKQSRSRHARPGASALSKLTDIDENKDTKSSIVWSPDNCKKYNKRPRSKKKGKRKNKKKKKHSDGNDTVLSLV